MKIISYCQIAYQLKRKKKSQEKNKGGKNKGKEKEKEDFPLRFVVEEYALTSL